MILYRTDDFNHDSSTTDLESVINYELVTRENEDLFQSISQYLGTPNEIAGYPLSVFNKALELNNKGILDDIVSSIIKELQRKSHKDLRHAVWLYTQENVENYYSFEGIDVMIDGYETSDVCLISYPNEGALYAYEENPKITERV